MFEKHVLESLGLHVKGPMQLLIDNSGCIDLICNWSSGGRTRHMDAKMFWLRELKEEEPSVIVPVKELLSFGTQWIRCFYQERDDVVII